MRNSLVSVIAAALTFALAAPAAQAREPQNRPKFFTNNPAYEVKESGGCPTIVTPEGFAQFDEGAAEKVAIAAAARAACLEAVARATATVARAEAGAHAAKMAADRGDPVFASNEVVAVGVGPATLAAGVGMGVVNPLALSTLGYQGAAVWATMQPPPLVITPPPPPEPMPQRRVTPPPAGDVDEKARAAIKAAKSDG